MFKKNILLFLEYKFKNNFIYDYQVIKEKIMIKSVTDIYKALVCKLLNGQLIKIQIRDFWDDN